MNWLTSAKQRTLKNNKKIYKNITNLNKFKIYSNLQLQETFQDISKDIKKEEKNTNNNNNISLKSKDGLR